SSEWRSTCNIDAQSTELYYCDLCPVSIIGITLHTKPKTGISQTTADRRALYPEILPIGGDTGIREVVRERNHSPGGRNFIVEHPNLCILPTQNQSSRKIRGLSLTDNEKGAPVI